MWKTESGGKQFKKEKEKTDKSTVPYTGFFTHNACAKNGPRETREVTNNLSSGVPSTLAPCPPSHKPSSWTGPGSQDTGGASRSPQAPMSARGVLSVPWRKPHQSRRLWRAREGKRANRWAKRPGAGTKFSDPEHSARPGQISASPRGRRGHTQCRQGTGHPVSLISTPGSGLRRKGAPRYRAQVRASRAITPLRLRPSYRTVRLGVEGSLQPWWGVGACIFLKGGRALTILAADICLPRIL